MSVIQQILELLRTLVTWWFLVEPWEQAIRVRCGKHVRLFEKGVYWKIPFFDMVYKQNVRRRVSGIPVQTLTAKDGKSLTIYGSIGYKIADVLKLHMALHDAEQSVQQEILGLVSRYVCEHEIVNCTPRQITEFVNCNLDLQKYGLADVEFFLQGYVSNVRTYRVLQDMIYSHGPGGSLNTQAPPSGHGMPR